MVIIRLQWFIMQYNAGKEDKVKNSILTILSMRYIYQVTK